MAIEVGNCVALVHTIRILSIGEIPSDTRGTVVEVRGNLVTVLFRLEGKREENIDCVPGELRVLGRNE